MTTEEVAAQSSIELFQYGAIGVVLFLAITALALLIRHGMRRMEELEDFIKGEFVEINKQSVEAMNNMAHAVNSMTLSFNALMDKLGQDRRQLNRRESNGD